MVYLCTMDDDTTPESDWPQWLRDADTPKAKVQVRDGVVHWLDGIWHNGTWHDGVWHDGEWRGGEWLDGEWRNGTWHDGVWHKGEWRDGVWYDGECRGGVQRGGFWYGGTWLGGEWLGDPAYHPLKRGAKTMEQTPKKHDDGKARLTLLPPCHWEKYSHAYQMSAWFWGRGEMVAAVTASDPLAAFAVGAEKYGRYSWLSGDGIEWSRLASAFLRHCAEHRYGHGVDVDSGLCHIDHMEANRLMLLHYLTYGLGIDDRPRHNHSGPKNE